MPVDRAADQLKPTESVLAVTAVGCGDTAERITQPLALAFFILLGSRALTLQLIEASDRSNVTQRHPNRL